MVFYGDSFYEDLGVLIEECWLAVGGWEFRCERCAGVLFVVVEFLGLNREPFQ